MASVSQVNGCAPQAIIGEGVVATDSAFLSVGFSVQDELTVNQRQIDRGYHSIRLRNSACQVVFMTRRAAES
jgi:phosphotransferase system IIB component